MKTLAFKTLLVLCLPLLAIGKDIPLEKHARVAIATGPNDNIVIDAANTHLQIEIWDKPEVLVEAIFRFRGDQQNEHVAEFLDHFQENVEKGISQVEGETRIVTFRSAPSKTKVGWENFTLFELSFDRDQIRLEYHIKMPATGKISITHSYQELSIKGDVPDLKLSQYSGKFYATKIGKAKLKLQYGEARIDNLGEGKIQLYENDLFGNSFGNISLDTKYSSVQVTSIKDISISAYESEYRFQNAGNLKGELKYSRLSSNLIESLSLVAYESRVIAQQIKTVDLTNSKYSRYEIEKVTEFRVQEGYEDNVRLTEVKRFLAGNSKYCNHEVLALEQEYQLKGYECVLSIERLSGDVGTLVIEGKYLKVRINTTQKAYELVSKLKYGNISFDENQVIAETLNVNDTHTTNLKSKNTGDKEGYTIQIDGYEVTATLN
jgi:hypothetical protein